MEKRKYTESSIAMATNLTELEGYSSNLSKKKIQASAFKLLGDLPKDYFGAFEVCKNEEDSLDNSVFYLFTEQQVDLIMCRLSPNYTFKLLDKYNSSKDVGSVLALALKRQVDLETKLEEAQAEVNFKNSAITRLSSLLSERDEVMQVKSLEDCYEPNTYNYDELTKILTVTMPSDEDDMVKEYTLNLSTEQDREI